MRPLVPLAGAALLALLPAQSFPMPASLNPAQNELPHASPWPLMVRDGRLQQHFAAAEVGASQLQCRQLELRFDGPAPACASATFTIQRLTVRLGVTARKLDELGSAFAGNLSQPLTTVVQAQPFSFRCDSASVPGPEPFGGGAGELRFPFAQAQTITIPGGGNLVVELATEGNSNLAAPALVDFAIDPTAFQQDGFTLLGGRGCPPAPNLGGSTLEVAGRFVPGGSLSLHGASYPPNAPVLTMLTLALFPQPVALPGTNPICWIYVDPGTGPALVLLTTDAGGNLSAFREPGTVPIPRDPKLCGAVLYVQNATPVPPSTVNLFGANTSNYRTIVLGCPPKPALSAFALVHPSRADAGVAATALPAAVAMRLQ
jgi:hypothetical protein